MIKQLKKETPKNVPMIQKYDAIFFILKSCDTKLFSESLDESVRIKRANCFAVSYCSAVRTTKSEPHFDVVL